LSAPFSLGGLPSTPRRQLFVVVMIIVDKINSILPTDNRAGSPLKHFAEVTLPLFDSLSPSSSSPGTLKAPFPLSRKLQLPISDDFCRHFTSYNYYNL
jgi:hypothetical protein